MTLRDFPCPSCGSYDGHRTDCAAIAKAYGFDPMNGHGAADGMGSHGEYCACSECVALVKAGRVCAPSRPPESLAPAATFALRTEHERSSEAYARSLCETLLRWVSPETARDVAARMVRILASNP